MKFRPTNLLLALLSVYTAFVLGFFPLTNVVAQADITVDSVRVDIWPEYDRPAALVIYNVTLSPEVSLPASIKLRIPAAAGQPYAVAWQSADQGLYDLMYQKNTVGEWIEISFSAPAPNLRIEYYDPEIQKTGGKRDFIFNWPGDYTVKNLSVMVQQPVNATNMSLRPDAGSGRKAEDGLTYYTIAAGEVKAGTTFQLTISYEKPDDSLTNPKQFQEAQPVQAVDSSTAGRVTLDQTLPWAVGGAGILLIAGGLFWYWRTNNAGKQAKEKAVRRHERASAVEAEASGSAGPLAFCHQCGKKASPGDVFCRSCGTRLK